MTKRIAAVLLALGLGGCFESDGSLYDGAAALHPFQGGAVVSRAKDGKPGHLRLSSDGEGYRFIITDKGHDFGEGYRLRFFALPDGPAGTLVFEATELCGAGDKTCKPVPAASLRYYGLVRPTGRGAEEFNPVCGKTSLFARLHGVTAKDYDTCHFTTRAALEKALLMLARQKPKADTVYRYQ